MRLLQLLLLGVTALGIPGVCPPGVKATESMESKESNDKHVAASDDLLAVQQTKTKHEAKDALPKRPNLP